MLEARRGFELRLHTPAHQGRGAVKGFLPSQLFGRDVPYFTRNDLAAFEARLAEIYGTSATLCLTSGTSQGVEAAVLALSRRHRRIWVLRNCHKSVINGLVLSGMEPVFLVPSGVVITPEELEQALSCVQGEKPTAIIFTYPTVEGWSPDMPGCIAVCRRHGLEIMVDESHGGHYPASTALPASAIEMDVDIVLHSLHKYVGGLVQTALLHLPRTSRCGAEEITRGLDLLETTTISNLLLLSIEKAVERLISPEISEHIEKLVALLGGLKTRQYNGDGLMRLHVPAGVPVFDPLKLFLTSEYADPATLARWFCEAGVDNELINSEGVLFVFSMFNTAGDVRRFESFCREVKPRLSCSGLKIALQRYVMNQPEMACLPRQASLSPVEKIKVAAAQGRISAQLMAKCPPGWPILIPGERITGWHLESVGADCDILVVRQ